MKLKPLGDRLIVKAAGAEYGVRWETAMTANSGGSAVSVGLRGVDIDGIQWLGF